MDIVGSCHCGAVTLEVPSAPAEITSCNCSICRRLGTLWAYYPPAQVRISGATTSYLWGEKSIALHHCPTCGCTTHWSPVGDDADPRMGINVRLLAPELVAAARVRHFDGAAMPINV